MKELRKQLHEVKEKGLVTPDPVWVKENKARLMRHIAESSQNTETTQPVYKVLLKTFLPHSLLSYARPVFTAAVILVVALAGWGASVSASFNSLPGDVLWNVKIAAEKTQIALSGKDTKIKKKLEYAERRVEEVKMVFESEEEKKNPKRVEAAKREIQKVKDSVKKVVEDADKSVKDTIKKDPKTAVELALEVEKKTSDIAEDLNTLKKVVVKETDEELKKHVGEAAQEANQNAFATTKTILDASNELEGVEQSEETEEVKKEVKLRVEEKLADVLKDTEEAKIKVGEKIVEISEPETVSSTEANLETTTVTSTIDIDPQEETEPIELVEVSEEVKNEVKERTQAVETSAEEVRVLIDEGKLGEALEKIQDLDEIAEDVGESIDTNTTETSRTEDVQVITVETQTETEDETRNDVELETSTTVESTSER